MPRFVESIEGYIKTEVSQSFRESLTYAQRMFRLQLPCCDIAFAIYGAQPERRQLRRGQGTYLVDVADSVDEERSFEREDRYEGSYRVERHHDHDSDDHTERSERSPMSRANT